MVQREEHPCFTMPKNKQIKLWRYISLPKFLALLQQKALFFARANYLGDPLEGSMSKANIAYREAVKLYRHQLPEFEFFRPLSEEQINQIFALHEQSNRERVQEMMVNCWHMNDYESAAMWKQYSSGEPIIAIQTTLEILDNLLPEYVYIGQINYIDYEKDFVPEGNIFYPIMHKRKSFEHERELRAVFWQGLNREEVKNPITDYINNIGLNVSVEINDLIQKIYIDPAAPEWFSEVVDGVCKKFSLIKPIHKSSLSEKALF